MSEFHNPIEGTSEPERYWTSTNLGEAVPEVMSPMCWSVWEEPAELGWLYSMYALGAIPAKSLVVSPDVNDRGLSVFYGRQALNVDAIRKTVVNLPGVDPDDFERDLMGMVRDDPPEQKGSLARIPVLMVKAPITLLRISGQIAAMHDDVRNWWLREVYDVDRGAASPTGRPIERLVAARDRFGASFRIHCVVRFVFQGVQSAVAGVAESVGDPTLATRLLSGVGGVNETRMSDDLWRLGHGEIDEEHFLCDWGYHGPNEGNAYATVWREEPAPVRSLATSYARRTDSERPRDREKRSVAAGVEAESRLIEATSALKRPGVRWLLRRARNIVRTLQVGKAGYLMSIDGVRSATRAFGREQVEKGALATPDDAFFLTVEECQELDAGRLANVGAMVAERRRTREEYLGMRLPVAFRGMPEPLDVEAGTEESDKLDRDRDAGARVEISGAACGGGVVEGRARVVLDPSEEIELDDGDILVCRFTDPSWAPIMSMAEALVIDMGGSASHGAVVARELGIPFVIGSEVGTRVLRDGDRIRVDGEQNLVTLLGAEGAQELDSIA